MDNEALTAMIDDLYDIRSELRILQNKAKIYNEAIIKALEDGNGSFVTNAGTKAYLSTRMLKQFDRKAAEAEDANFVAKYTTLKAATVLMLA